jgi:hypothetical protein
MAGRIYIWHKKERIVNEFVKAKLMEMGHVPIKRWFKPGWRGFAIRAITFKVRAGLQIIF